MTTNIDFKRSLIVKILLVVAELIGLLIWLVPFIIGYLTGSGIEFNMARSMLENAKEIQPRTPLTFWIVTILTLFVVGGLIWYQYRIFKKGLLPRHAKKIIYWDILRILGGLMIGYFIYRLFVYVLIDLFWYYGALQTIPYMYAGGILIGACLISLSDFKIMQKIFYPIFKRIAKISDPIHLKITKPGWNYVKMGKNLVIISLSLVFIIPNLIPVMGLAPSTDYQPSTGYGSTDRPYEVDVITVENHLPDDIAACLTPYNDDNSWYMYLYLPRLSGKTFSTTPEIPIAIYNHGFSGKDVIEYDHSLRTLASRGVASIFVQYAQYMNYSAISQKIENTNETNLGSAASFVRYNMTWNGVHTAVNSLAGNNSAISSIEINASLGTDYHFDFGRMFILGHSYGGGMSLFIGSQILSQGWGTEQLIFDLEAPTTSSQWPEIQVNLSVIPDHTMVNIIGYEDDNTLSPCTGMVQHERFFTRDNSANMPADQVAYLYVQSDRHGFPRLVANHYFPNDLVRDHMSNYAYFRRIDAMAGFLVADANGESAVASDAQTYFQSGGENMVGMGTWSDGTPVLPLLYSTDPWGIRSGPNIHNQILNPDNPSCEI